MPVYNAEKFLEKTINSVVMQKVNDYELIIINDGSLDNSLNVCESFAITNNNIIIINQVNSGPSKARNEGIKIAKGDYITFVDADDYLSEGYYNTMLDIAKKFAPDIIVSNINSIGKNKSIITNDLPKNKLLNNDELKIYALTKYYKEGLGNIPTLYNKFYKTSFIKNNNLLIDESRVRAEDYWFNFYAFIKAKNCYAIDKAYYNYNILVEGSIMKSFRADQYDGFLRTRNELLKANIYLNIEIDYNQWDTGFINNANEYILLAIKNNRWEIVSKILKDKTFNSCIKNYKSNNLHTSLIKTFQKYNFIIGSKLIYKLWSTKLK